jgi:AcrR family transcriptional regulator
MGIAERRGRERIALRTRIVEAARDIVSEQGLDALSMRAIAERVEYSPATLYLYFRDKDELLREVVAEGFRRLGDASRAQLAALPEGSDAAEHHRALGRAYARFALENTGYFRVMFELPAVARAGLEPCCSQFAESGDENDTLQFVIETVRRGIDEGVIQLADARRGALISWALIHGLTSLYLSGHLRDVESHEEFLKLVEEAMASVGAGWSARRSS